MSRFADVLCRTHERLLIPQPARSRVLLEIRADMEDLYSVYVARGLPAEEAESRTVQECDLSDETLAPLGIEHWDWSFGAEGGHRLMDGSLQLCPRDMMRLGRMMLDDGRWRGKQVVSPEFARTAIASHLDADAGSGMTGGYGYFWWTLKVPGPDGPLDVAFANGWGSQFIIVVPKLDLVLVITGGNQDNGMHMAPQRVVALGLVEVFGAI